MAGNDTPTGVGRGTSGGISRGRRVRGTTLSSNDMDSSPNIEDPLDDRIWIRPGPENT
jgi:hypothetical protein